MLLLENECEQKTLCLLGRQRKYKSSLVPIESKDLEWNQVVVLVSPRYIEYNLVS